MIVLNAVLDWLLIFGRGPIPGMGVHGAAISTGISRIVGMCLSFVFLRRSILKESLAHFRPHVGWFGRILNIGWPASVQNLLWTSASAVFLRILAFLPGGEATVAQAALTVGLRIESVAFMPGVAYAMAATPLVGQNLGAGQPGRAEHSAWVATGQAVFVMSSVALVFYFAPWWLARGFTTDMGVVHLVVRYLRINAISEPFLALGMVMRGALQGAGDTRIPAWITVSTLWFIRLPLAWVLANRFGYGAVGAWTAMCLTTILSGVASMAWFKWGTWRTLRV